MLAKDSIPLYLFWQIIKAVEEVLTSLPEMFTMYGQGVSSSKNHFNRRQNYTSKPIYFIAYL